MIICSIPRLSAKSEFRKIREILLVADIRQSLNNSEIQFFHEVGAASLEESEALNGVSGSSQAGAPGGEAPRGRGRPLGSKNKTPEQKEAAAKAAAEAAKAKEQEKIDKHADSLKRAEEKKAAEDAAKAAAEDEEYAKKDAAGTVRRQGLDAEFGSGKVFDTPLKRAVASTVFDIAVNDSEALNGVLEDVGEASASIKDPRSKNMISYPVGEIVIGMLLGLLSGLVSVRSLASFFGKVVPFLRSLKLKSAKFDNGAPKVTGLRLIMKKINADDAYNKLIRVFLPKMEAVVRLSDDMGAGGSADGWDPGVLKDPDRALWYCYDILVRGTECYMCVSYMLAPSLRCLGRPVPLDLAMAAKCGSVTAALACEAIRSGATYNARLIGCASPFASQSKERSSKTQRGLPPFSPIRREA
jgi:hypothetical protein